MHTRTSVCLMMFFLCGFSREPHVVVHYIRRECDHSDSKTREKAGEHLPVREYGMLPPCFAFGPRIASSQ